MNDLKLIPLNHKVLVEERIFEEKTTGGILLPTNKVEQYQSAVCEGVIVGLADDAFDYYEKESRPKVGQVVHFPKFEGILRKYNDKNYRLVHDETIYAVSDTYLEKEEEIINGKD
jgi:co-chaperonin GroES (HSP10)